LAGWRVVYANPTLSSWVDPATIERAEATVFDWLPSLAEPAARFQLERVARGEAVETGFVTRVAAATGERFSADVRARRVEQAGRTLLAVAIRRAPVASSRIGAAGRTDPLTGLADRAYFQEHLATLLGGDPEGDRRCAVLFVDVDGFKRVNDDYGHLVGDRVLREVAQRLAGCVRSDDIVARFGGDEFVVLLARVRGPREIEPVVERIRTAFERPITLAMGEVKLAVSVGAAEAGPEERSVEGLIHAADQAMYAAKRAIA